MEVGGPDPGAAGPTGGADVGRATAKAPKVTLQHVADAVGVSRMTVSNAFSRPDKLSAALRERILETAQELGYAGPDPSARALARGRAGTVGLIMTSTVGEAFSDAVATEFIAAVGDALAGEHRALTLVTTQGEAGLRPADLPMDGAILYICEEEHLGYVEAMRQRGTPLVTVDQQPVDGIPAVNVADFEGARAGARHLIELGHTRIALLTWSGYKAVAAPPALERERGWREACAEAGIDPVVARTSHRPPDAAYDAARELLARDDRPTGVLCISDVVAAQTIRAAADLGLRVPEDLSVVGYDDAAFAPTLRPALTTVRQSLTEKGRAAVAALDALITDAEPAEMRALVPTELVVRESTGPAPS